MRTILYRCDFCGYEIKGTPIFCKFWLPNGTIVKSGQPLFKSKEWNEKQVCHVCYDKLIKEMK